MHLIRLTGLGAKWAWKACFVGLAVLVAPRLDAQTAGS